MSFTIEGGKNVLQFQQERGSQDDVLWIVRDLFGNELAQSKIGGDLRCGVLAGDFHESLWWQVNILSA